MDGLRVLGSARLGGSASGAGAGAARLPPLKGRSVSTVVVGDRGGEVVAGGVMETEQAGSIGAVATLAL